MTMSDSLERKAKELDLDVTTISAPLCRAAVAASFAAARNPITPIKNILQPLLDVANATPSIASDWRLTLTSRRRSLLGAISGYGFLGRVLECANGINVENVFGECQVDEPHFLESQRVSSLLAMEISHWSKQLQGIEERLRSLVVDAMIHAIDVRFACSRQAPNGRMLVCVAAKDSLAADGLTATPLSINGAAFTYPFEASLHVKLSDASAERLVFRDAHTSPGDDALVMGWRVRGLLPRGISTASLALATVHALRWPLIIDPDGVGARWICSVESSTLLKASPITGLCIRTMLLKSTSLQCPLLLNIDKFPSCCVDTTLFDECFTSTSHCPRSGGGKRPTHSPGSCGFRLYIITSISQAAFDNSVVASTFNIISFFTDDISVRDCLGHLAVTVLAPSQSNSLSITNIKMHCGTMDVLSAENVIIEFLNTHGAVQNQNGPEPFNKLHAPKAVCATETTSADAIRFDALVKDLHDAISRVSTLTEIHRRLLRADSVYHAMGIGAIGAAAHIASARVSVFFMHFPHSLHLSAEILASSITLAARLGNKKIMDAFTESISHLPTTLSTLLFSVEAARCLAVQRHLSRIDLGLGDTHKQSSSLNNAVAASRVWQLLLQGPICSIRDAASSCVREIELNLQDSEALTSGKNDVSRCWETKIVPAFAQTDRTLFAALLQCVVALHQRNSVCNGLGAFHAAQHALEINKRSPGRSFEQTAEAVAHNLACRRKYCQTGITENKKSGPLCVLDSMACEQSYVSLLLIDRHFARVDLDGDGVIAFVQNLATKFGVERFYIIQARSQGAPVASVLEALPCEATRATNPSAEVRATPQLMADAQENGEWVLVYNIENFSPSSLSWLGQIDVDAKSAGNTKFQVFFSTNVPTMTSRMVQGTLLRNTRIFCCCAVDNIPKGATRDRILGDKQTISHITDAILRPPRIRLCARPGLPCFATGDTSCEFYRLLHLQIPPFLKDDSGSSQLENNHSILVTRECTLPERMLALKIEIRRYNAVIKLCHDNLTQLSNEPAEQQCAASGLHSIKETILIGHVPDPWIAAAPHFILAHKFHITATSPLKQWCVSFQRRVEYLRQWLLNGQIASLWLGVLYSPRTYLNAILADASWNLANPSSGRSLSFIATPFGVALNAVPQIKGSFARGSFIIEGLSLSGASWNSVLGVLQVQESGFVAPFPDSKTAKAPPLLLTIVQQTKMRYSSSRQNSTVGDLCIAMCPLYGHNEPTSVLVYFPSALQGQYLETRIILDVV